MKKKYAILFTVTCVIAFLRPYWDSALQVDFFYHDVYQTKVQKIAQSKWLLLGDSRVFNGVDPKFAHEPLTLNFAYPSNSFTENYLDYVRQNMGKNLARIYVGLSVQSLTDFNLDALFRSKRQLKSTLRYRLERIFLNPINIWNIKNRMAPKKRQLHNKGFVLLGDSQVHENALTPYPLEYKRYQFDIKYIENLKRFADEMKHKGIKIIYFLTPSKANVYDYQKDLSGIDQKTLLNYFDHNVLVYPEQDLEYVDGDHLTRKSTHKISQWLFSQNVF